MDLSGPRAQGHVMCLLECKAKALGQIRQHFCCAHYDEIIASFKDYKPLPAKEVVLTMVNMIANGFLNKLLDRLKKQHPTWDLLADDTSGADVSFHMPEELIIDHAIEPNRRIGLLWDGTASESC